jgi:protein SCO1/2
MNTNMRKIYEAYKDEPAFVILSHTCDPETDTVAQIKKYADSMKVNTARWWFVTGPKDSLYMTARNSYLLDDPKNNLQNIEDQFLHTQYFALVDKNGQVRKIVDEKRRAGGTKKIYRRFIKRRKLSYGNAHRSDIEAKPVKRNR